MAKEIEPQQELEKRNIDDNSLFLVQVDFYNGKFLQNKRLPSPWPRQYTDQELTDWLAKFDAEFQAGIIKNTLDPL